MNQFSPRKLYTARVSAASAISLKVCGNSPEPENAFSDASLEFYEPIAGRL